MSAHSKERIAFNVDTRRILTILSNDIYDSPYAMLRENVQNAYDAILMRQVSDSGSASMTIEITIRGNTVVIRDTGIGMTEEVLKENYWKAGSSGKLGSLAHEAGVIGSFGIGAMANFGVCSSLHVRTKHLDSLEVLISEAKRDELSIARECISLERSTDSSHTGTTITAVLADDSLLEPVKADRYLREYVRFLPIPVRLNGRVISGDDILSLFDLHDSEKLGVATLTDEEFKCTVHTFVDFNSRVLANVTDAHIGGESMPGLALFKQGEPELMTSKNRFGLARAPITGHYLFGGHADFAFFVPTAGREALSRESIATLHRLLALIERGVSEQLAVSDHADNNVQFLEYVASKKRYQLASRVTVEMYPGPDRIVLEDVASHRRSCEIQFYMGNDKNILRSFSGEGSKLLHISQANPRRKVQSQYLNEIVNVDRMVDKPNLLKVISRSDLSIPEAAILVQTASTLSYDYVLSEFSIEWAEISHGVPFFIDQSENKLAIYISRISPALRPILEAYDSASDVFGHFVRDFVRVQLFPQIMSFVPSATREGADALRKALQRNRELYRYDDSEHGSLEALLSDYLAGITEFPELLRKSQRVTRSQTQMVTREQVGRMEDVLPDVVGSPSSSSAAGDVEDQWYEARPSIMRLEAMSDLKLLTVNKKYPQLNEFQMFLALSDRLFSREGQFFHWPHSTRVLWAGHRVIYVFVHASGELTMYYDVEFREPLAHTLSGGRPYPSTTIVAQNRIYVPVPEPLHSAFEPTEGYKEFFVRFDTITE